MPNKSSDNKERPLHIAAKRGDLHYIHSLDKKINVNVRDEHGMTPLHHAAENNHPTIIRALLNLGAYKNLRDFHGRAALDIALHGKKTAAIQALGANVDHPGFGKPKINQHLINKNLRSYVKVMSQLEHKQRTRFLTERGHCNGWAFLYQYYLALKAENEFFEILKLIATWNGKSESLNKPLSTIKGISSKIQSKYRTLGQLFEYTINDVVWFQQATEFKDKLNIDIKQNEREKQWELIHDDKLSFHNIFRFTGGKVNLTKEELCIVLETAQRCPNTWLDFSYKGNPTAGNHAISISITADGNLRYFNCNNHFNIPNTCSARQVANYLSRGSQEGIILHSISMNKFRPVQDPNTEVDYQEGVKEKIGRILAHKGYHDVQVKLFQPLKQQPEAVKPTKSFSLGWILLGLSPLALALTWSSASPLLSIKSLWTVCAPFVANASWVLNVGAGLLIAAVGYNLYQTLFRCLYEQPEYAVKPVREKYHRSAQPVIPVGKRFTPMRDGKRHRASQTKSPATAWRPPLQSGQLVRCTHRK
jgi:ankyrin repeat protein